MGTRVSFQLCSPTGPLADLTPARLSAMLRWLFLKRVAESWYPDDDLETEILHLAYQIEMGWPHTTDETMLALTKEWHLTTTEESLFEGCTKRQSAGGPSRRGRSLGLLSPGCLPSLRA